MREASTIDPSWEQPRRRGRSAALVARLIHRVAPYLSRWASGRAPELRVAWGRRVWVADEAGLHGEERAGAGWEGAPRNNYNERVLKKQRADTGAPERVGRADVGAGSQAAIEPSPNPMQSEAPPAPAEPATDAARFSQEELARDVARRMGIVEPGAPAGAGLKGDVVRLREQLQGLDDVSDWDKLEAVDEDLYLLHKAVEYKLRNHKANEAKARLDALFKGK